MLYRCEWYRIYNFIESVYAGIARREENSGAWEDKAGRFATAINSFFSDEGIGWQLVDGHIVTRGTEAFEAVVKQATGALEATERPTAAKHLHEALQDLSRRPEADFPGAVYHVMGCLECVARDLTGDSKTTLGEALKRYPGNGKDSRSCRARHEPASLPSPNTWDSGIPWRHRACR